MQRHRQHPIHRPTKHLRLRKLTCFPEVEERLRTGFSTVSIAKYIQEDCQESLDVNRDSLADMLQRYRNDIPPNELILTQKLSRFTEKSMEKIQEGIDVLAELREMIHLQKKRILMDHAHEEKMKKALASVGNEVKTFKDLVVSYNDVESSLGLKPKQLGEVNINVNAEVLASSHSDVVNKVLNDPIKRRRLMGLADKMLSLANTNKLEGILKNSRIVEELEDEEEEIPAHLLGDDMPGAIE